MKYKEVIRKNLCAVTGKFVYFGEKNNNSDYEPCSLK